MYVQTQTRSRIRTGLTQRQIRNRADTFLPALDSDRGFGIGFGRSSGYGETRSYVPGPRPLFRFR